MGIWGKGAPGSEWSKFKNGNEQVSMGCHEGQSMNVKTKKKLSLICCDNLLNKNNALFLYRRWYKSIQRYWRKRQFIKICHTHQRIYGSRWTDILKYNVYNIVPTKVMFDAQYQSYSRKHLAIIVRWVDCLQHITLM